MNTSTRTFRVCRQERNGEGNPEFQVQSFLYSELPRIPKISGKLLKILDEIKQKKPKSPKKLKKTTKRKKIDSGHARRKRMNSFMAFRCFYSRDVPSYIDQSNLSQKLAELWKEDPNKDVWRRYVDEYNISAVKLSFVNWLLLRLKNSNIKLSNECDYTWSEVSFMSDMKVEDVFVNSES